MKLVTLASLALVIAGCGSDPISTTPDAGGGGTTDLSGNAVVDAAGGSQDLSHMTAPPDLIGYSPPSDGGTLMCGTQSCTPATQVCCVKVADGGMGGSGSCVASGACTGGLPVQCAGTEYCGGNPCCLALSNKMPTGISCETAQTGCVPNIDLSGNGKTRLCHTSADCIAGAPSNTNFKDCCTGSFGGVSQQFCFNSLLAGAIGATCQ